MKQQRLLIIIELGSPEAVLRDIVGFLIDVESAPWLLLEW